MTGSDRTIVLSCNEQVRSVLSDILFPAILLFMSEFRNQKGDLSIGTSQLNLLVLKFNMCLNAGLK